jgi:predicted double-glycine peptidase
MSKFTKTCLALLITFLLTLVATPSSASFFDNLKNKLSKEPIKNETAPNYKKNNSTLSNKGTVRVNTYLNVRKGSSTNYKIIGGLRNNDSVTILEKKNGWYKINYSGGIGWVCGRYITRESSKTDDNSENSTSNESENSSITPDTSTNGVLNVPKRTQFDKRNIVNGVDYRRSWCGPMALGMVLDYKGVNKTGYELAKLARYTFKRRVGTPSTGIVQGAKDAGFKNSKLYTGKSMNWLKQQINKKNPVIVNVDTRWKGHYIVVKGFDKSGNVIVNDPGKGALSRVSYTISKTKFWSYLASKSRRAIIVENS